MYINRPCESLAEQAIASKMGYYPSATDGARTHHADGLIHACAIECRGSMITQHSSRPWEVHGHNTFNYLEGNVHSTAVDVMSVARGSGFILCISNADA